jgi:hypothetical protein
LLHAAVGDRGGKDRGYRSGVTFRDPDGIALEFFAHPADRRMCGGAN